MHDLGRKIIVMTPHVMSDMFKNTPETILPKLNHMRSIVENEKINVELHAAAEYYVDENFLRLTKENKGILSFGTKKKFVLLETAFINESPYLREAIFYLQTSGYVPVLAHPERYTYLYDDFKKYENLFEMNIMFQINILSLIGYYSPKSQKIAEKLIEAKMVHFLGSDCHNHKQMMALKQAVNTKYYKKALELNLLNNQIFESI